jgi:hypothetical protein
VNDAAPERRFTAAALRLWGALLVWFGYFLLVYVVAALACERGFADARVIGVGVVSLVSGVGLVLSLAATLALLAATRRGARDGPARGARFTDRLGWTLGLLALVALVWTALPHLLLRTGCA